MEPTPSHTFTRDYFEEESADIQRAWILNFGKGFYAAVAFHEMSQVLISPRLFDLPYTPLYCSEVLLLGRVILPVMDVATLLDGRKDPESATDIIGIAVYQQQAGSELSYVGLHLQNYPIAVRITDEMACELPSYPPLWEKITLSCFDYEGRPTPILDLAALFSDTLRQMVRQEFQENLINSG